MKFRYFDKSADKVITLERNWSDRDLDVGEDGNLIRLMDFSYINTKTGNIWKEEKRIEYDTKIEDPTLKDPNVERYFPVFHKGDGLIHNSDRKKRQAELETGVFDKIKK